MCGGYQVNPASIVAPVGSDLPSVDDGATWEEVLKSFKGKTIGIPTPLGTGTANLMVGTLASVGLQDGDYTLVNIGTGATAQAAIVAGQVDAANVITPNGETMVAGGIAKELLYMPDGPKSFALIGGAWEARRSWVEQNPEVAKGFCEAMAKAYDYVQDDANKDEVNDLIRGIVGETNDVGIEALDLIRGRAASLNADITEEQFETTQSTLIDLGIVDGATPVEYTDAVQISR
jgi:ABC-type nitrate/sulfonate/bicarbonate transport system substrate-binding protein